MDAKAALEKVVKAWKSLPGGRGYGPNEIERWLAGPMKIAIDEARQALAEETKAWRRKRD